MQPRNHTKEQIGETIILEQFLRLMSPELQVWIRERNPDSAAEAASLADVFVSARRRSQPWTYAKWKGSRESNRPLRQPPAPRQTSSEGKSAFDKGGPFKQHLTKFSSPKAPVCYQCGQEGHIRPKCPNNPDNQANICTVPRGSSPKKHIALHCYTVVLNGQEVSALVDTGSMQSLVSADMVPAHVRNYTVVTQLRCVHGDERSYPTASVQVEVLGQTYLLEVGVVDSLPYQGEKKVLGHKRQRSREKGHNGMWFLQEVQWKSDGAKDGRFAKGKDSAGPSTIYQRRGRLFRTYCRE